VPGAGDKSFIYIFVQQIHHRRTALCKLWRLEKKVDRSGSPFATLPSCVWPVRRGQSCTTLKSSCKALTNRLPTGRTYQPTVFISPALSFVQDREL
jgi:hypothetical protein